MVQKRGIKHLNLKMQRFMKEENISIVCLRFVFMIVLSSSIVIGNKINVHKEPYFQKLAYTEYIYILLIAIILNFIGTLLINYINNHMIEIKEQKTSKKWWFVSAVLFVFLWIIYLFVYYPGMLTADSINSLLQADNLSLLYNHTPIMYTLLVTVFVRLGWFLGDRNLGIFLFSLAQMVIMALTLGYSVYWIRTKFNSKLFPIGVFLFYGLNPIVAIYTITMWKDVLFAAWMLIACLFLFDIGLSGGKILDNKNGIIKMALIFILLCFGRNNGIYITILIGISIIYFCKFIRLKLTISIVGIIFSILFIQGPLYNAFGIDKSGFAESVGIPLQQICYTIIKEEPLETIDKEFIENIIPIEIIKSDYSPVTVDNIKFNSKFNTRFFEENKTEFIKLYIRLLLKHPRSFVEAYLLSTSGFWHIEPVGWACAFGIMKDNEMGFYDTDYIKQYVHIDLRVAIQALVAKLLKYFPIFNIGFMVWFVFFYVLATMTQRYYWKNMLIIPLIGCWLTLMIASPLYSQFRYMYSYHLVIPYVLIFLFARKNVSDE